MKAIERLYQYIDYKKFKPTNFEKEIGLSSGYLSVQKKRKADLGEGIIIKINDYCRELNINWLLTGEGEMLKNSDDVNIANDIYNVYDLNTPAAAGSSQIINDEDRRMMVPNMYIPGMRRDRFIIRVPVKGDSMHATIKDGDRVVALMLEDINDLRPGHIYVIADADDGVVVKRVYRDGNIIELVSDNEIYPPYKKGLNDIFKFYHVEEVHTTDLRNYYDDVRKEVRDIKQEVEQIQKVIRPGLSSKK